MQFFLPFIGLFIILNPALESKNLTNKKSDDLYPVHIQSKTHVTEFQTIQYNQSIVLVWELCGVEARSEVTTIFESDIGNNEKMIVLFNPSINSLIFETATNNGQILNKTILDVKVSEINTLFFLFSNKEKIHIFVDCPKSNRVKLEWESPLVSKMNLIHLFKNSHGFSNLESALSTFKCRDLISVLPGTVIHFTGQLNNVGTLIFSFTITTGNVDIIYSFSFINGSFQVISNNGQVFNINITQQITNGFYLLFTASGIEIYINCPYNQQYVGIWSINFFNNRLQIETSRVHHVGNGASQYLMLSFCTTNNLINILDGIGNNNDCFPVHQIQTSVQHVDSGNSYTNIFLPTQTQIELIEQFGSSDRFNYAYLMSPVHQILIASRINARPRFFYRPFGDYVEGFTDGQSNFWIGLDILNKVTNKYNYKLRIETEDGVYVEEYRNFTVGDKSSNYKLTLASPVIHNCNGFLTHNGYEFSAYDKGSYSNMAISLNGGFWHRPDRNRFCFSCETGIQSNRIYFNNYYFGGYADGYGYASTYIFKMYLIP